MIELSPVLLLAAASAMLGLTMEGKRHPTLIPHGLGQSAQNPDTAFVHHAGYWSHYAYDARRSSWPLPATNDCDDWARFAEASGVLIEGPPRMGDVFLHWSARHNRFVHAGIVASYQRRTGVLANGEAYMECETIEANAVADGPWYRTGIQQLPRKLVAEKGDRLIRWADVKRKHPARPAVPNPHHVCAAAFMREAAA
jgi:hypothetical protein